MYKKQAYVENGSDYFSRLELLFDEHIYLKSLLANMEAKQQIQ